MVYAHLETMFDGIEASQQTQIRGHAVDAGSRVGHLDMLDHEKC